MPEKRVAVASKVGLHARPAALVAKAAAAQPVAVQIAKAGGTPVAMRQRAQPDDTRRRIR